MGYFATEPAFSRGVGNGKRAVGFFPADHRRNAPSRPAKAPAIQGFSAGVSRTSAPDAPLYGYMFYSPELGRFINRDPIEEKGGSHLYAFAENSLLNKYDPHGLSSETHQYCAAWKWKRDNESVLDDFLGDYADWWNYYQREMKKRRCMVIIDCDDCCKGSKIYCGAASPLAPGSKSCFIKFCTNRCGRKSYAEMLGIFIHELTHCWQNCSGGLGNTCDSCICQEIQAYHRQFPHLPEDAIWSLVKGSCAPLSLLPGETTPCSESDYWEHKREFGRNAGWFNQCKQTGSLSSVF